MFTLKDTATNIVKQVQSMSAGKWPQNSIIDEVEQWLLLENKRAVEDYLEAMELEASRHDEI